MCNFTFKGLKNMKFHYCKEQANQLKMLKQKLFNNQKNKSIEETETQEGFREINLYGEKD
jgi:hypothetical protein